MLGLVEALAQYHALALLAVASAATGAWAALAIATPALVIGAFLLYVAALDFCRSP